MSKEPMSPKHRSARDFALDKARAEVRIDFICAVTTVIGIVRGVVDAWPASAMILAVGGVLSIAGVYGFTLNITPNLRSSWQRGLGALAGLLPYLYGIYLVAYEGVWGGIQLAGDFGFLNLVVVVALLFFGYRVVYWTWRLSELAEALRTGKIVVDEESDSAAADVT